MAKTLAKVFGVVFLLVGVLGFFANPIVGETGFFHADTVHNIVHILLGLILVLCGTEAKARMWMKIIGVVYLLLAIVGFLTIANGEIGKLLGIAAANSADNWLHLVLGLVLLLASMGGKKVAAPMNSGAQM